jgi:molecular chaperone GrpE
MPKVEKDKPKSVKKTTAKKASSRKVAAQKREKEKKGKKKLIREKDKMKELRMELKKEHEASNDYRDKCLRALADLANYRKRVRQDRQTASEASNDRLICDILPVLDNFERALDPANPKDGESFKQGIELIYSMLKAVLEREGVRDFCSVGEEFDPAKHQAIYALESEDHPAQTVINEVQKGYTRNDRLLRPAQVTVSKGSPETPDQETEDADESQKDE